MTHSNTIDTKFVTAVKRMEDRTTKVRALVVIDPDNTSRAGRIVISYPKDGAGRVNVIAWLPSSTSELYRHHGSASGGGYDKATAAMGGARIWDKVAKREFKLVDQGHDFRAQIEAAGYLCITAC